MSNYSKLIILVQLDLQKIDSEYILYVNISSYYTIINIGRVKLVKFISTLDDTLEFTNKDSIKNLFDSLINYIPNNILELVKECVETCDSELTVNPEIVVYGKVCIQHRSVGFYSDKSIGYKYNNKLNKSKPLHQCLIQLLEYINIKFNYDYNGILINKYLLGMLPTFFKWGLIKL